MLVRETKRLRLRKASAADATFFVELMNDLDWLRFIGDRGVRTTADAEVFILEQLVAGYQENGFGLYVMEQKEGNLPIGICGILRREGLDDPDIGFALLPAYRGAGFAYEAACATLDIARNDIGLDRILAITRSGNTRSIRLLERLGLCFERSIYLPDIDKRQLLYTNRQRRKDRFPQLPASGDVR